MFLDTLRKVLRGNCAAIVATPIPHGPFRLAYIIETTGSTSKSINEIARVTGEMMSNFEWIIWAVECYGRALVHIIATSAWLPGSYFAICIISTRFHASSWIILSLIKTRTKQYRSNVLRLSSCCDDSAVWHHRLHSLTRKENFGALSDWIKHVRIGGIVCENKRNVLWCSCFH